MQYLNTILMSILPSYPNSLTSQNCGMEISPTIRREGEQYDDYLSLPLFG